MEFRDRSAPKVIGCGQVGRKRVAPDRLVVAVLFRGRAVPRHQINEKHILRGILQNLAEVRIVIADMRDGRLRVVEVLPKRTMNH
jgi:hypothetical protein